MMVRFRMPNHRTALLSLSIVLACAALATLCVGYMRGVPPNDGDFQQDWSDYAGETIHFDYNSHWVSIEPGETLTLIHDLEGGSENYVVVVTGKSSSGEIHQANFGTSNVPGVGWIGLEWFGLTNTRIKVHRAEADGETYPGKDWNKVMVRILLNQMVPDH